MGAWMEGIEKIDLPCEQRVEFNAEREDPVDYSLTTDPWMLGIVENGNFLNSLDAEGQEQRSRKSSRSRCAAAVVLVLSSCRTCAWNTIFFRSLRQDLSGWPMRGNARAGSASRRENILSKGWKEMAYGAMGDRAKEQNLSCRWRKNSHGYVTDSNYFCYPHPATRERTTYRDAHAFILYRDATCYQMERAKRANRNKVDREKETKEKSSSKRDHKGCWTPCEGGKVLGKKKKQQQKEEETATLGKTHTANSLFRRLPAVNIRPEITYYIIYNDVQPLCTIPNHIHL